MSSGDRSDSYITAIALQLQQTQALIHTLLAEIRESSASQAALISDLKHLRLNVDTLSNIIRGGDGNTKPLVMEVETLKHAGYHLDKRITACVSDLEDQILSLGNNLSESVEKLSADIANQRKAFDDKFAAADKQRREDETTMLKIRQADEIDMRLDRRGRFQIWSTIIIAIISLIGSIIAISMKK